MACNSDSGSNLAWLLPVIEFFEQAIRKLVAKQREIILRIIVKYFK
jgi:hypothetical protein